MKSIFDIFSKDDKDVISSEHMNVQDSTDFRVIDKYKKEINNVKIENEPFRLSELLHALTNNIIHLLKMNEHIIYYDVDNTVGRYIVGDREYIEKILLVLLKNVLLLNKGMGLILKVTNSKNKFLVFEVINKDAVMEKGLCQQYEKASKFLSIQSENLNTFVKIKMISTAMEGSVDLHSNKKSGTVYTFKLPYHEDQDDRSHQEKLKKFLTGKKALFIAKNNYDTQRTQYIFETYGMHIQNMKLDDFEQKKPNLSAYNMAIIRSKDLSYKHISFFKNMYQNEKSDFKIIIIHEMFENKEKIELSKSIAHAELYCPTVIGDVEEILYQIFILQSKAVRGINNLDTFNTHEFFPKGTNNYAQNTLSDYQGAHIAIVSDNNIEREVLQNILENDNIRLSCLNNGADMLDLLQDEEVDLIFTAVDMPIMNGIHMAKKIRTTKKWSKIPIIAIVSNTFPEDVKNLETAGVNAGISKPIEVKDIYIILKNFLIVTEKEKRRKKNDNHISATFDKDILDVSKGIKKFKNHADYLRRLLYIMDYMKNTQESFENMIKEEASIALNKYTLQSLTLYEEIYAAKMTKMFKDLDYFIYQGQRLHLNDYISIYEDNIKELEIEINKYIDEC